MPSGTRYSHEITYYITGSGNLLNLFTPCQILENDSITKHAKSQQKQKTFRVCGLRTLPIRDLPIMEFPSR